MRRKDKKELLIRAATDLFARKGYTETSIKEIGAEAGLTVSLVYYYFKDKEEILYTIIERSARDLIAILREIQSNEPDPLEGLKRMIIRQVIFSHEARKATKLNTLGSDQLNAQRKKDCLGWQREVYDIYMRQLQKLKELSILNDINLTVVNFVIFGMINWFNRWYKTGKSLGVEDVANEMIKVLEFGIVRANRNDETARSISEPMDREGISPDT